MFTNMAPEYLQEGYAAGRDATIQKIQGLIKRLEADQRGRVLPCAKLRVVSSYRHTRLGLRVYNRWRFEIKQEIP